MKVREAFTHAADRALPELARRAGREVLATLAARVEAVREPFASAMGAVLVQLGQEREQEIRRIEAEAQVLRAALSGGRGDAALVDLIGRRRGRLARLGDQLALRRFLDGSAVEDRFLRRRHAVDQAWELLATIMADTPMEALSHARRDELRRQGAAIAADRTTRWPVRVAAVHLLASLVREASAHAADRVETEDLLHALASDRADDPWIVDAALGAVLHEATGPAAEAVLTEAIHAAGAHPAHLFLRARVAGRAANLGAWRVVRALLEDPSEHVRMEAAVALARAPEVADRQRVADLLLGADEGWRVAARGALELLAQGELERVGEALTTSMQVKAAKVVLDLLWGRVIGVLPGGAPELGPAWDRALARWAESTEDADVVRLADVLSTWRRRVVDAGFAEAFRALGAWLATAAEGATGRFASGALASRSDAEMLDLLYLHAHEDLDLSATPVGASSPQGVPAKGWRLRVGTRDERAAWRVAHELRHPRHDKRQAWLHTVDTVPEGPLVAWSGRLAEVVATTVPGRRVSSPTSLAWHEHLPLPANLLAAGRLGGVRVRVPRGEIRILRRARGALPRAHQRYVDLAGLRERLVVQRHEEAIVAWDGALRDTGFDVGRVPLPALIGPGLSWLGSAGAADGDAFSELAAIGAGAIGLWLVQKVGVEASIRRMRRRIPLVVGGWGSRGKSSVERLKAALFHALGYVVFCKSTGCEAMVLIAVPGAEAAEVFLYRPRDKATIVENQVVLRTAAGIGAQVLLWECMALNPAYTHLLQTEWMRDDLTTITNTYPDHEDIQGPSGRDVADVISEFTPVRGHLVTSEQQFTPVLARRARERGASFHACRPLDWDLVPRDLIARFPYREYDRNIALVAGLATALGVPQDVAIRAMADNVLTDLGAFKVYGPIDVHGRQLSFAAGNSANDRASFLSNWERMDLDAWDPRAGLDRWLIPVINNRADRLARQAVFARIAALDMSAERIVIIGTNVMPTHDAIHADLREELAPRLREVAHGHEGHARLRDTFGQRLRRRAMSPAEADAVIAESLARLAPGPLTEATVAAWREEVAWLATLQGDAWDVEAAITTFVGFLARRVVPFPDSAMSGDQILVKLAELMPEGAEAMLLGCANIKGTGLDFVYRWVSIERTQGWLRGLAEGDAVATRERLERLAGYEGYGLFDARQAQAVITALRDEGRFARLGVEDDAEAALGAVERRVRERTTKLGAGTQASGDQGLRATARRWWKQADVIGSMRRRWKADRLYRDLADQRVGYARAAVEAKHLVDDEKA